MFSPTEYPFKTLPNRKKDKLKRFGAALNKCVVHSIVNSVPQTSYWLRFPDHKVICGIQSGTQTLFNLSSIIRMYETYTSTGIISENYKIEAAIMQKAYSDYTVIPHYWPNADAASMWHAQLGWGASTSRQNVLFLLRKIANLYYDITITNEYVKDLESDEDISEAEGSNESTGQWWPGLFVETPYHHVIWLDGQSFYAPNDCYAQNFYSRKFGKYGLIVYTHKLDGMQLSKLIYPRLEASVGQGYLQQKEADWESLIRWVKSWGGVIGTTHDGKLDQFVYAGSAFYLVDNREMAIHQARTLAWLDYSSADNAENTAKSAYWWW